MKPFPSTRTLVALGCAVWLVVLGCRVADIVAQSNAVPTRTVTRTVPRPTFTSAPPTLPPTNVPPPTSTPPPVVPSLAQAVRRTPTRKPTLAPPPTPIPSPTPDLYQGYFYRIAKNTCVSSPGPNTVIVGTVYERGAKVNGITIRVSAVPSGPPAISDFVTGVDPFDSKHIDGSLQGQYRLGLAEGGYSPGNWSVFVIDNQGNQMSQNASVHTDDKAGCNIATVDFAYQ